MDAQKPHELLTAVVSPDDPVPGDEDSVEPEGPRGNSEDTPQPGADRMDRLFSRIDEMLGDSPVDSSGDFRPAQPQTLKDTGLSASEVERLVLGFLFQRGAQSGRATCTQIRLPYPIVETILRQLKSDHLVSLSGSPCSGAWTAVTWCPHGNHPA